MKRRSFIKRLGATLGLAAAGVKLEAKPVEKPIVYPELNDVQSGFGLAQLKPEGETISYDRPTNKLIVPSELAEQAAKIMREEYEKYPTSFGNLTFKRDRFK